MLFVDALGGLKQAVECLKWFWKEEARWCLAEEQAAGWAEVIVVHVGQAKDVWESRQTRCKLIFRFGATSAFSHLGTSSHCGLGVVSIFLLQQWQ